MYTKEFSIVYNKYWASFSKNLVDRYVSLVEHKHSILDLGCGTGNFLQKIEYYFDKSVGVDLSPAMISIAKQNCKKSLLFVQDITQFSFNKKFDMITCNFDVINHLRSLTDWQKVFDLVYEHLTNEGVFVFDYNTLFKFKNFTNIDVMMNKEECVINVQNIKIDNSHIKIKFSIYDKINKKTTNLDVEESFFDDKDIYKALTAAGFFNINVYNKDFSAINDYNYDRLYVVCYKNEGTQIHSMLGDNCKISFRRGFVIGAGEGLGKE